MHAAALRTGPLPGGFVLALLVLSRAGAQAAAPADEVAPLENFATIVRADETSREPIEIEIKLHFHDLSTAQLRAIGKCSQLERLVFRPGADRLEDKPAVTSLGALVEHLLPLKKLKSLSIGLAKPRFRGPRVLRDADLTPLARLRSLEEIDLSRQPLTGEGLKHLIDLPNLQSLILDEKAIGDESYAGLRKLPKLKQLSMRNTPLHAVNAPAALSIFLSYQRPVDLPNWRFRNETADLRGQPSSQLWLRYHLARCSLKGLQISELGDDGLELLSDCPTLEFLDVSGQVRFTDQGLRWLPSLQRLKVLHLGSTDLIANRPQVLAELPQLEVLQIANLPANDDLDYLGEIPALRDLQVTSVAQEGKDLAGIGKCQGLEKLTIGSPLPTRSSELKFLAGLENLQHLSLRDIDPRGLANLPHPEKVQHLRVVSWNPVQAEQLRVLGRFSNLESFTLVGAGLDSGDCLWAFVRFKKLQTLHLASFGRPGKMPRKEQVLPLAELSELRNVQLSAVEIGPAGFVALSSLPHISEIRLQRMEIDDRSIPALKSMKKLELLMVNDHQFSKSGRDELFKALTRPDDGPRGVRYGLNDYR